MVAPTAGAAHLAEERAEDALGLLPVNLCVTVQDAPETAPLVGVLALQGGFHEHKVMLGRLGARVCEVRQSKDLTDELDALVVPGGESTTMAHLARHLNLLAPLRDFVASGRPVMGTCAGLIFLADEVDGQKQGGQELMGGLDVTVRRNFFGSQVDSFETTLAATFAPGKDIEAVFIRAPAITRIGDGVRVLSSLDKKACGLDAAGGTLAVAVQQGRMLGMAFHPELTTDDSWHAYFLSMVREAQKEAPRQSNKRTRTS
mmetsp:Transcript_24457/g.65677  ORF Transcript_24457/g.65677 Transcript_24457/m.65677 type:complete len:259 (-) Transcript_24457:348-1124(-)